MPLNYGGFEEGSGRVRVVFEQLWWIAAVVRKIEPAIECGRIVFPRLAYDFARCLWNVQSIELLILNHVLNGGETHFVKLESCLLEGFDFTALEAISGGLVPIRLIINGVKSQPEPFDALLEVCAWFTRLSPHQPPYPPP